MESIANRTKIQIRSCKMTNPQVIDELFWRKNHEDVNDWAKILTMVAKVWDLNGDKLFKFAKLNLRGRAKKWFRKLQPTLINWTEL
jgi:hypothetical protein